MDVIIPSLRPVKDLIDLVNQIRETAGYPCRILPTGLVASASANRNMGLSLATGEVVAMVDDDIEFNRNSQDWLRVFAETLARPEVVMVSAQLYTPDGLYAYMTGLNDCGLAPQWSGETVVPSKRLLTACCAFKPCGLRFDEEYVGSGFEDVDFCNQLAALRPEGVFLVCHSARAIHRNEAKNQNRYWTANEAVYLRKWGTENRGVV